MTFQSEIKAYLLMIKPSISLLLSSEIILKQLFASAGLVNIGKYLLRLRRIIVNPLRPVINLQILLLRFHTFRTEVGRRSCSNINRI